MVDIIYFNYFILVLFIAIIGTIIWIIRFFRYKRPTNREKKRDENEKSCSCCGTKNRALYRCKSCGYWYCSFCLMRVHQCVEPSDPIYTTIGDGERIIKWKND